MRYQQVLTQIIGKRVTGVISTEASTFPQSRVFLSFDDNTFLELYGVEIKIASGLDTGSVYDALQYAKKHADRSIKGSTLVSSLRSVAPTEDSEPLTRTSLTESDH